MFADMWVERTRWQVVRDPRLHLLPEGKLLRVLVEGRAILFARIKGRLAAMLDQCPHQGKSMAEGWCEDGCVVCPWHRFAYDPFTGASRSRMTANAITFEVREVNGQVSVGFSHAGLRVFGIDLW